MCYCTDLCTVKGTIIRLGLILFIAAAVVAAVVLTTTPSNPKIQNISVSTDANVYHSNDLMKITVSILSSESIDNLSLMVEGIVGSSGKARLNETRQVNLTKGRNDILINYTMPVCSRCAGLPPGAYAINVTLLQENSTIGTASHSILIES